MKLVSLKQAEAVLSRYIPAVSLELGKNTTLDRMWSLLEAVGNPHEKLNILHVAGTSGKTSTSYFLAALLTAAGKKTGLTISPHIDSITERLQINMRPMSESQFSQLLGDFLDLIKQVEPEPTYFELLIVFAYWIFDRLGVDYAIIETGLGGQLDATNVATRSDKICIITDIGLDHTQILGTTLAAIAQQKAGIIHPGNKAFMFTQSPEITDVFKARAKSVGADLTVLDDDLPVTNPAEIKDLPLYQLRNWLLAYDIFKFVADRDKITDLSGKSLNQTMNLQVPARMDRQLINGKTLIMDGAHNMQKTVSFVQSFQKLYPGQKAAILLAFKTDKNFEEAIAELIPISSEFIFTTFNLTQDMPASSVDPKLLADYCQRIGFGKFKIIENSLAAYQQLLKSQCGILVITGSFYLISQVRKLAHLVQ